MGDFFSSVPAIGALHFDFEETDSKTTLADFVNRFIKEHECKSLDNPSGIEEGDHIIEKPIMEFITQNFAQQEQKCIIMLQN